MAGSTSKRVLLTDFTMHSIIEALSFVVVAVSDDSLAATPVDIVCVFLRYTVNRWPSHRVLRRIYLSARQPTTCSVLVLFDGACSNQAYQCDT